MRHLMRSRSLPIGHTGSAVASCAIALLALAACHEDALAPGPADQHAELTTASALANSWITKAPMPNARVGLVAANVNGTIYAIGGATTGWGGRGAFLRSVAAYTKAGNVWTSVAPLPIPLAYAGAATVIQGKIYVAGGMTRSPIVIGRPITDPVPSKSLYVYDPATNSWARKADLPFSTSTHANPSAAISGRLYLVGGPSKGGSSMYRYNPGTDSWSQRPTAPHYHYAGVAAEIDGKLYVVGGYSEKRALADLDVYDPATNSWTTKAAMPDPRYGAVGRAINGKLYVAAGLNGSGYGRAVEVYDPATNTWVEKPDIPTGRWSPGGAVAGGALFVLGGDAAGIGVSTINEAYVP
jgi:N-acetylneuraminic acid mutarotase